MADESPQSTQNPEATTVEEVMVWGTSVKASSLQLKEDSIAIKQADHISDLLRTIPGVDVGGAHSLNQRITIRSMDNKDLRISIDGAEQNNYMYHHMGNLHINADILQSVDVNIGTNSVINGGLGGAVRFETKSARQLLQKGDRYGGRLQVSYGDNWAKSYAFTGYGQLTDNLDILAYHNIVDRDNFEVGRNKIKDENGLKVPGTNGTVKGLKGKMRDSLLKLGWDITPDQRLTLGYEHYRDKGRYSYRPDMGLATDLAITNTLGAPLLWPTKLTRDTYTANYDWQWADHSFIKATVYRNTSELERDETGWLNSPFPTAASDVEGEAESTGVNLLGETEYGIHTFTYGIEWIKYETDYRSRPLLVPSRSSSEQSKNWAFFLQDRIQVSDQVAFTLGARHDSSDLDTRLTDKTYRESSFSIAGEYQPTDSLLIKLSSTQLFKAPEVAEVFIGAGLNDTPNPNIDEETGLNSEFAVAFEDSVLGADRFAAGFTLFKTTIDDHIYDYAPGGMKDNVGDMEIQGIEAYIGYDIGQLRTLLTFSRARSDLDASAKYPGLDNARIDREQGDTFSLNVDYDIPRWNMALHWDAMYVDGLEAGRDLDGASSDNSKEHHHIHNISARWMPQGSKGVAITVGIDNLFDEYYASQSSRTGLSTHPFFGPLFLLDYEPGRNAKVTLSYQF